MKKMLYCNICDILTDHTDSTCMITEKKKLVERSVSNEREEETDEETGSQDDSTGEEDETGSQDDSTGEEEETDDEDVSTDKTGSQDDSTDDEEGNQDEQRMELSHEEYLSFDYTNFQDDDGISVTLGIEDENDYHIFVEKEKIKELATFLKQVAKKLLSL